MKVEIPDFLLEMSQRMNTDDNRCTSHPFWQVRCKEYIPAPEGYNDHHWELIDSEEGATVYRSDTDSFDDFMAAMQNRDLKWARDFVIDFDDEGIEFDDIDWDLIELPEDITRVHVQEIEKVVWTGFTEQAALDFINRRQNNYRPLYTYVESAYWSPELRQLQDWIKSLSGDQ